MKSSLKMLLVLAAILAVGALFAYFFTAPAIQSTEKEARRFYQVAVQGTHIIDTLREAPDFHGLYFGSCAHIEKAGTAGEELRFVFVPRVGERVKFATVKDALAKNSAMLRDYPACRKAWIVYMKIFPYRGVVAFELDPNGYIFSVKEPLFSN